VGDSARRSKPIAAYGQVRETARAGQAGRPAGDPIASACAIKVIEADSAARLQTWRAWQPTAELAQG
jgi:hypothetical protein